MRSSPVIAIEAFSCLTPVGLGREAFLEGLKGWAARSRRGTLLDSPEPVLKDRKMAKFVSRSAALALAVTQELVDQLGKGSDGAVGGSDPWRTGLYFGAPAPYASDKENYSAALRQARQTDGAFDLGIFAENALKARPVAGLLGLPNGALCYASILCAAKGRNAAYTSGQISGHAAVMRAKRDLETGAIDRAVVVAYATPTEGAYQRYAAKLLNDSNLRLTDVAVAISLTRVENSWPATLVVGGALRSAGKTSAAGSAAEVSLAALMNEALIDADLEARQIDLILGNVWMARELNSALLLQAAVENVFAGWGKVPPVIDAGGFLGYAAEATGMLEVGFAHDPAMISAFFSQIKSPLPHVRLVMIVNHSPYGEQSCLILRKNPL